MYVKSCHQTFIVPTCQTCNKDGVHDYPAWLGQRVLIQHFSTNNGTLGVRELCNMKELTSNFILLRSLARSDGLLL